MVSRMLGLKSDSANFLDAIYAANSMVDLDMDGKIIAVNDVFSRLYGDGAATLPGSAFSSLINPESPEHHDFPSLWQKVRTGQFALLEFMLWRGKDQRQPAAWLVSRFYLLKRRGTPYRVVVALSDVTEAHDARARNISQIEAVRHSMALVEFDRGGALRLANPLFAQMLGTSVAALEGRLMNDLNFPQETTLGWEAKMEAAIATGNRYSNELCWRRADGSELWLNCTFNPLLNASGVATGVVLFANDITEAKQRRLKRMELHEHVDGMLKGLVSAVGETSNEAGDAARAASVTSNNVQAVAAGASQLAGSVTEISEQVERAQEVSNSAVNQTKAAIDAVESLSNAASQIASVVDLIASITSQTNLLALNATIEAARAGEAGKGFAVVAGEVKTLAAQTAKATGDIANNVTAVQKTSEDVRSAIDAMAATINDINMIAAGISAAVEQQSGLSMDISRNMQEAADGVARITGAMQNVARLTEVSTRSIQEVSEASAAASG